MHSCPCCRTDIVHTYRTDSNVNGSEYLIERTTLPDGRVRLGMVVLQP